MKTKNERLRILQIFNRYLSYGGEEGSVYRIGDALQELHDVEYFLSSTAEMLGQGLGAKVMMPFNAAYNRGVIQRLERFQKAGKFDVWQIHNVFPGMSPVVYAKAFEWDIPIVHYLHNYRLSCVNGLFLNHGEACQRCIQGDFMPALLTKCWHESHLQSGFMGLILKSVRRLKLFEKVRVWVAISEAQKAVHVKMGIPEDRIHVIHHFYETKEEVLPLVGPGHALFVGRLSEEKGVYHLLRAWRELSMPGRKLFIVGEGPERRRLESFVETEGVTGVEFKGFLNREQQREIWNQCLFSVVPSIWMEPFGMTVLEAWSKGRPVLGHRIGALPELIEEGKSGYLLNPASSAELAERMEQCFRDPKRTLEMGQYGYSVLKERFNRRRWTQEIGVLYAGLGIKSLEKA